MFFKKYIVFKPETTENKVGTRVLWGHCSLVHVTLQAVDAQDEGTDDISTQRAHVIAGRLQLLHFSATKAKR